MLAPLSWLKEYVEITLSAEKLGEKLTEVGLGCEKITQVGNDVIFEFEITPNRPDLLSIIGIAAEIAAIEGKKIKYPKLKTDLKPITEILPLIIKTDPKINPRFTGIIISGITVKDSPSWLKEKLIKIGQRPINNIVDITNYVMFELGNPIHAFDYRKIAGSVMTITQTNGGEEFKSVDGIKYRLPKGAVVIKDKEKIIDLCGIKGGFNSGTFPDTKAIFIRVPVEIPTLTRKVSLALGLRSEASSIFERGVNSGGTIDALRRCVDLILELAGGKIASPLYDIKEEKFEPWSLDIRIARLNKILGVEIPKEKVISILKNLNLSPKIQKDKIKCTIPTYRNDLKIEEDIIEEVARLYGYNNFPKTIPYGQVPIKQIPYFKNYRLEEKIKNILIAAGFSEIYAYGLISEQDLVNAGINPENTLRVDNPVNREYEYLRPTLEINLIKAFTQNQPNFEKISLFELGKVYLGENLDKAKEAYFVSGISNAKNYFEVKGLIETLLEKLGVKDDPTKYIEILNTGIIFELNLSEILKRVNFEKAFMPIAKYPPIIEDLAFIIDLNVKTIDIINGIKEQSNFIVDVSLLDQFKDTRTFHIIYQNKERNLTNEDVVSIREKILKTLKEKFSASLKE